MVNKITDENGYLTPLGRHLVETVIAGHEAAQNRRNRVPYFNAQQERAAIAGLGAAVALIAELVEAKDHETVS